MDIDETATIDPAYLAQFAASHEVISKQHTKRVTKEGEVKLQGVLQHFKVSRAVGDKRETAYSNTVPEKEMRDTRDGSKKYPVAIAAMVAITDIQMLPGIVEARTDGKPGWRVKGEVHYLPGAEELLRDRCAWAHLPEQKDEPDAMRIRRFIDQAEQLTTIEWINYEPNAVVKVKVPDNAGCLLRQERDGVQLVQPFTPCTFFNAIFELYVGTREEMVEDDKDAAAAAAPADANGAPIVAGVKKEPTKPKVKKLAVYPDFHAKGGMEVHERHDPGLVASERLHGQYNKNEHWFVPMMAVRNHGEEMPRHLNIFVRDMYQTPFKRGVTPADMKGVTIMSAPQLNPRDFFLETNKNGEKTKVGSVCKHFNVWQWVGEPKPATDPRYSVTVFQSMGKTDWRKWGIPDLEMYGQIMMAHPDVGTHVCGAELGWRKTMEHPCNKSEYLEARPGDKNYDPNTATVRGYYTFYGSFEPDLLRYFRQKGLLLSQAFVAEEFKRWKSTTGDGEAIWTLDPIEPVPDAWNNARGAVVPLGNGWYGPEQGKDPANKRKGRYHAFTGDCGIFFQGHHDFYVLARTPYEGAPPRDANGCVDDFVAQLKAQWVDKTSSPSYWIYAVAKSARMDDSFYPNRQPAVPAVVVTEQGEKRERQLPVEEEESSSGGDYDDEGGSPNKRRLVQMKD